MDDLYTATSGDGKRAVVSHCDCLECGNDWFVHNHQEFAPKYCPYCGLRFDYYVDKAGAERDLAGRPLWE